MRLFRRPTRDAAGYEVHFEHPTQPLAASFLKAAAEGRHEAVWGALSHETRGLLEGRYASRLGLRLASASGVGDEEGDARVGELAGPVALAIVTALGGPDAVNATAVSAARLLTRREVFVLLLPRFDGASTFVREEEWKPGHVLGFVYEDREWRVDLGLTATLSDDAGLPDPLGETS
jgi:hypothetical protein